MAPRLVRFPTVAFTRSPAMKSDASDSVYDRPDSRNGVESNRCRYCRCRYCTPTWMLWLPCVQLRLSSASSSSFTVQDQVEFALPTLKRFSTSTVGSEGATAG